MLDTESSEIQAETYRVALILVPGFPLVELSNIVEPLRAANALHKRAFFEWVFLSLDGEPVTSSSGVSVGCGGKLSDRVPTKMLFVCSGCITTAEECSRYHRGLRQYAQQGCVLGGASSGALLLAGAGLLDGYQCTVHWEYIDVFSDRFPRIDVVDQLYVMDRERITSAGGTATMDLMLDLIGQLHGSKVSSDIAHWFIHETPRRANEHQHKLEEARLARQSIKMAAAIKLMRENIEEPVSPRGLAVHANVSLRQLERLFKKNQKTTIQKYYQAMRLDYARRCVIQSEMSLVEIVIAVGFRSHSHFSKCYRERFSVAPAIDRQVHSTGVV